jgi:hypothetical protein
LISFYNYSFCLSRQSFSDDTRNNITMFSKLKAGFIPHGSVSTKHECDEVRYEAVKLATMIAAEVRKHGISSFPQIDFTASGDAETDERDEVRSSAVMKKTTVAALAEIVITETIYYHQLAEIGCFLASSFSEQEQDEKQQQQQLVRTVSFGEEEGEDLCGGDCDCFDSDSDYGSDCDDKCETEHQQSPLAANLLIASGRVRSSVMELTEMLDVSYKLLAPAGYIQDPHNQQSVRNMYGLLVSLVYTRIGGRSYDADNGDTMLNIRRGVLSKLCEISQNAWALMNLCGMLHTFKFRPNIGTSPLFDTILIQPTESVFGNNGWRPVLQAAVLKFPDGNMSTTSPPPAEEFENDDVPSVIPPGYAPKRMTQFDIDAPCDPDDAPCYD